MLTVSNHDYLDDKNSYGLSAYHQQEAFFLKLMGWDVLGTPSTAIKC